MLQLTMTLIFPLITSSAKASHTAPLPVPSVQVHMEYLVSDSGCHNVNISLLRIIKEATVEREMVNQVLHSSKNERNRPEGYRHQ